MQKLQQPTVDLAPGVVLGGWKLGVELGSGAFGRVFEATHTCAPGGPWILKVAPILEPPKLLKNGKTSKRAKKPVKSMDGTCLNIEREMYELMLKKSPFIARLPPPDSFKNDKAEGYRYLPLERLDCHLWQLAERYGGRLPLPVLARAAVDLIKGLAHLHAANRLYHDCKPYNFMIRERDATPQDHADVCVVIDLGTTTDMLSLEGALKPCTGEDGTAKYLSLAKHEAKDLCPMMDFESLAHVLVELSGGRGTLPWGEATSRDALVQCKRDTPVSTLCKGLPSPVGAFLKATRGLPIAPRVDVGSLLALWEPHVGPSYYAYEDGVAASGGGGRGKGKGKDKGKGKGKSKLEREQAQLVDDEGNEDEDSDRSAPRRRTRGRSSAASASAAKQGRGSGSGSGTKAKATSRSKVGGRGRGRDLLPMQVMDLSGDSSEEDEDEDENEGVMHAMPRPKHRSSAARAWVGGRGTGRKDKLGAGEAGTNGVTGRGKRSRAKSSQAPLPSADDSGSDAASPSKRRRSEGVDARDGESEEDGNGEAIADRTTPDGGALLEDSGNRTRTRGSGSTGTKSSVSGSSGRKVPDRRLGARQGHVLADGSNEVENDRVSRGGTGFAVRRVGTVTPGKRSRLRRKQVKTPLFESPGRSRSHVSQQSTAGVSPAARAQVVEMRRFLDRAKASEALYYQGSDR